MSRFTGFSEKSFFKGKSQIWAKSMDSDSIALNFLDELETLMTLPCRFWRD